MTPSDLPADHWGIRPVLFHMWGYGVPSYGFFVGLGLLVGLLVYWREARRNRVLSENTFFILLAAAVGGALGAKIPIVLVYGREVLRQTGGWGLLLSGRSIVGGLAGGALGVWLVKRHLGIQERKGNLFAPAIAAGVAIGRIGCFLRGCCYGKPTTLPWGVDFGDGIPRHPTQLYEAIFMLALFVFLTFGKKKTTHPALLFWILMASYFTFRFFEEFIRTEQVWWPGLTFFQWISLAMAAVYGKFLLDAFRRKEATDGNG